MVFDIYHKDLTTQRELEVSRGENMFALVCAYAWSMDSNLCIINKAVHRVRVQSLQINLSLTSYKMQYCFIQK